MIVTENANTISLAVDPSYVGGDGDTSVITNTISGHRIATHSDGDVPTIVDINETITALSISGSTLTYDDESDNPPTEIILPVGNTSVMTDDNAGGHKIAQHSDGGVPVLVDIHETVTTLIESPSGTFTYTNENDDDTVIVLPDGLPTGSRGDMLYHNGTDWVVLTNPGDAGTDKQWVMHHKGAADDPEWVKYDEITVNVCISGTPTGYTILGIATA